MLNKNEVYTSGRPKVKVKTGHTDTQAQTHRRD